MLSLANDPCPLIAILRGLAPEEAPHVGQALFDAGFHYLEVPLNRPGACDAIRALLKIAPPGALVGGGTVLTIADVDAVGEAGGQLIVSPNCEHEVIRYAVDRGMLALPGVATPSEAFRGLAAGAQGLKLFPAEMITPPVVKAMRSILPADAYLLPVGGIHPHTMAPYIEAGANGFGIGGQLYKPGIEPGTLKRAAVSFMLARQSILQRK
jgi:2-dehydro-3-deoxyphosphogalactonate aldolase